MHDDENSKASWILLIAIIVVATIVISGCFFVVQPGERGMIFSYSGGLKSDVYGEGLHFKMPVIDSGIKMNVKVQKQAEEATGASKDLQDVNTTVAVNFRINPDKVQDIYRRTGVVTDNVDYIQSEVMNPIIQESVKKVTAKYDAVELITNRSVVKKDIEDEITNRMLAYDVIVTDVSITEFRFSETFRTAIEEKVTAQQNALKEQNNLAVVEFQKQQKILAAEGDAEAIRIVNEQLSKSSDYVNLLFVQRWNGVMPLSVGGNSLITLPTNNNASR